MSQLAKMQLLLVRAVAPAFTSSRRSQVRWIASGKSGSDGLAGDTVVETVVGAEAGKKAEKTMGFFEAADVLSKPPVKPKRLRFDFHLWMFIVAMTPSAVIFISAQLIRRVIRRKEKELQEQEKAELRAKIDAAYSSDGPDHPRSVRSRGQRHVDEREERKLARAQGYLDEKEVAALKASAQARGEGRRVSSVDEDRGAAPIGQSLKGEVGKVGGAEEKMTGGRGEKVDRGEEKSAGVESDKKQSPGEGKMGGDASEGEVQRLKAKVAELERGLKGLEESLRGGARVSNGQTTSGPSAIALKDGKGALTPPGLGVPGIETRAKSADKEGKVPGPSQGVSKSIEEPSDRIEKSIDSEAVSRRHSLFDYIWPHWLRTSSEGRGVDGSERPAPSKGNPQRPP